MTLVEIGNSWLRSESCSLVESRWGLFTHQETWWLWLMSLLLDDYDLGISQFATKVRLALHVWSQLLVSGEL
jgi:hypothetical protein